MFKLIKWFIITILFVMILSAYCQWRHMGQEERKDFRKGIAHAIEIGDAAQAWEKMKTHLGNGIMRCAQEIYHWLKKRN